LRRSSPLTFLFLRRQLLLGLGQLTYARLCLVLGAPLPIGLVSSSLSLLADEFGRLHLDAQCFGGLDLGSFWS
jgi:hypothetical protein